jgi:ketosteroid isomerase-like protein
MTESEVKNFIKLYEEATNSHEFNNVVELIHEDALYRFTDGDFNGIDEIKSAFEITWNKIQNETYKISDLKIINIDNNSATFTYTFNWSGIVDGTEKSGNGRGTNVIVNSQNKIQCIYEHLSK